MRVAEWKRTVRPLLPDANWEFRGSLCYRLPVHRVLIGVLGEGSGFDTGVYIWRVVMPLFVPGKHVTLSWSNRIGGGASKYRREEQDAQAAAIRLALSKLGTEEAALREILASPVATIPSRRILEVVAYTQLLLGDFSTARSTLTEAASGGASKVAEQKIVERMQLIGRLLDQAGPDGAVSQLDQWCDRTAGALGLRRSRPEGADLPR